MSSQKCFLCGNESAACDLIYVCPFCMDWLQAMRIECSGHEFQPIENVGYLSCKKCGTIKYDLKEWVEKRKKGSEK